MYKLGTQHSQHTTGGGANTLDTMCGGHADEPVAGFAEGDVVRLDYEEKNVRGRVGRVGKTNPEWGLRIDWPDETLEPVWVPWLAFQDLDYYDRIRLRLVDESLLTDARIEGEAARTSYVDFGEGWLKQPVVMKRPRSPDRDDAAPPPARRPRTATIPFVD